MYRLYKHNKTGKVYFSGDKYAPVFKIANKALERAVVFSKDEKAELSADDRVIGWIWERV